MGLMTLISKKLNPEKHQHRLRAPPYERNVSSRSPVRIVRTVSAEGDGAPAPVIRTYRDENKYKSATVGASSRQGRKIYADEQARANTPSSSSLRGSKLSLFKLDRPVLPTQATYTSRNNNTNRAGSIKTDGGHRGFVDLLDAQSELSPVNFHRRIKASGARDYGEDVADRNIGINGHNLDSRPVQEFYACISRPPSLNFAPCRPSSLSGASRHESDEDHPLPHRVAEEKSLDSARWSQQADSSQDYMLGRQQPILSPATQSRIRSSKRNSLNALQLSNHTDFFDSSLQRTEGCVRRHSFRQGSTYGSGRNLDPGALEVPGLLSAWDSSSSEADGEDEALPQIRVSNQPILSPQPTSFRLSAAIASPIFTSPSSRTSRRNSTQSAKLPPTFDSYQSSVPDLSNLPHHLKERTRHFKESWPRDIMAEDRESAPSPTIKTSRSDSCNRTFDYPRARGGQLTPPLSRQSCSHVPVRSSSIRRESVSSTAPTMSSPRSATFARPLSYHTADTSVDLRSIALSSMLSSSISSEDIGHDGLLAKTEAEGAGNQKENVPSTMSSAFEADVPDDDDSFVGLQRHQSGGEEDLLFGNGYGAHGQQLPGLDDMSSAAPAPVVMLHKPRLRAFSSCEDIQYAHRSTPVVEREYELAISNDILSSVEALQAQGAESLGGLGGESPVRILEARRYSATSSDLSGAHQGSLAQNPSGYKNRPSAIYHGFHNTRYVGDETIEEEGAEKNSVISAVRLRREAKTRKRAERISKASEGCVHTPVRAITSDGETVDSNEGKDPRISDADFSGNDNSTDDTRAEIIREEASVNDIQEAQFYTG